MKENIEGICEKEEVSLPGDSEIYSINQTSKSNRISLAEQESNAPLSGCYRCHTPCQSRPCVCYR